jgi:hypothetical protein
MDVNNLLPKLINKAWIKVYHIFGKIIIIYGFECA